MKRWLGLMFGVLGLATTLHAKEVPLDLTTVGSGVTVLESYSGQPDAQGILETIELKIPEFTQGIYYRSQWWPYGGNRLHGKRITGSEGDEGGLFVLFELKDGGYLAILPLCGDKAYSFFAPADGRFRLKLATHGTTAVNGDMPLVSWAKSDSPYEACHQVWAQACETLQIKGNMKLREQKTYPEVFKYLGWCSWEGYKKNITSGGLVAEFKGLDDSPVPVRYFLVDDGHFSDETLKPKLDTFPNGYKPLTDLRTEDGIKWVGMWHAMLGNANAMPVECPPEIKGAMMSCHNGRWIPKPDGKSIDTFMRYLLAVSERDSIDFVKVDFCGTMMSFASGTDNKRVTAEFPPTAEHAIANPSEAVSLYSRIYQKVVAEKFNGLINCNWHVPQFIFNSVDNNVGRCSGDYKVGNLKKAKEHLFTSYNSIPWLGQIAWGDHDMFHSSDKFAGRMMAISKAMSGAPIYLSDKHKELVYENIMPMCYEDGLLLRPLAPAAPVPDDLFMNLEDQRLYRAMAPLANRSAAFVLYNLHGDKENDLIELSGTITPEDYRSASGMIQPWTGKWELPAEGLLVYDHQKQTARKLGDEYKVTLKGFGDYLIQLSPIKNGWSVIGRTDKYLSAAAVEILTCDDKQLKLRMHESGPLGIWLEKGIPEAEGIAFFDKGNGLFTVNLPMNGDSPIVTIRKK